MQKADYLNIQEKALGNRIKELRIVRGYNTQYQFLKDFTGKTERSSIMSRIEKGVNLDFITLVKLLRTLKTSMLCLFDFGKEFEVVNIVYDIGLEESVSEEIRKFSARVRKIRKDKGLIQLDLALESLIGDTSISHYELGEIKPEFDTIASIAFGLKIEVWELFDFEGKYSQFK